MRASRRCRPENHRSDRQGPEHTVDAEARERTVARFLRRLLRMPTPAIERPALRPSEGLEAEVLSHPDALTALQPEWAALYDRCPAATPFSSPQWLLAWWSAFGGSPLHVITVRDRGELVGLLPLYWYQGRQYLAGNGISDYLDALVPQRRAAAIAGRLWDRLGPCELNDLPPWSALVRYAPQDRRWSISETAGCHVTPLAHFQLPSRLRKNLASERRRLEAIARLDIDLATAETLAESLEALFRLHDARWSSRGGSGVMNGARLRDFHRRAASALQSAGMLRLYSLRMDCEIRAALYCFSRGDRTYYYLSGFDPALSAYSPGSQLIDHAIRDARERGQAEFDFLRGEESYKTRWGAQPRSNYRIILS